jgi:hypothetical protein
VVVVVVVVVVVCLFECVCMMTKVTIQSSALELKNTRTALVAN